MEQDTQVADDIALEARKFINSKGKQFFEAAEERRLQRLATCPEQE